MFSSRLACCGSGSGSGSGVLFGVNSVGRVLYLSAEQDAHSAHWIELPYVGIDFKRLSAAGNALWALGGDHQPYVFIFGVEVPIRVKEVTYENQRWNPVDGFCSHLLPTDRPKFSSVDGLQDRSKESVKLPTLAWQWDDRDWYIDTNFNGKTLDREGWTYAVDFPAEYHAKKSFTSCVRRRRWIRHRRYVATESWAAVPPIHKEITEEPLIDIAVGGHELPNGDPEEKVVWAVTVLGRVMVRQGVTSTAPEGTGWLHIPTGNKCEVSQVSVAPSGLVWAVTWNGKMLVRLGVTRLDPTGTSWCEVDCPDPTSQINHISVGESSVWAISRDRRVWFRNGIRASSAGESTSLAKGTKWVEMVGELHMLSTGPDDQVFGVTDDDHAIVYRTGVSLSDLSGKTWRSLTVQPIRLRSYSVSSSSSNVSSTIFVDTSRTKAVSSAPVEGSSNASFRRKASELTDSGSEPSSAKETKTPPPGPSSKSTKIGSAFSKLVKMGSKDKKSVEEESEGAVGPESPSKRHGVRVDESMYVSCVESVEKLQVADASSGEGGSEKPTEATHPRPDNDRPTPPTQTAREDSLAPEVPTAVIDHEDQYGNFEDDLRSNCGQPQWLWLTAGTCKLDAGAPPASWFVESLGGGSEMSLSGESWRVNILQKLRESNEVWRAAEFSSYESAIERTSWVRKSQAKFQSGEPRARWETCTVELEQTGSPQGGIDFGTLSIFGNSKRSKEHLSLFEITAVVQSSEKTLSVLTSSRSLKLQPLQIRFSGDLEMEGWQADLVHGMNSVRGVSGPPSPGSLFSITNRGEMLVFDPKVAKESGCDSEAKQLDGQYFQDIPLDNVELPLVQGLENGFSKGSVLSSSLRLTELCENFSINLQTGRPSLDADIALHFNPRIKLGHTVLNSKREGKWASEEEKQPLTIVLEDGNGAVFQAFTPGHQVQIVLKCEQGHICIFVNGQPYARFAHRIRPEEITHFRLSGDIDPVSIVYHSKSIIIPPSQMYWRCLGGGHFLQVETCSLGVTWALGYDATPWIYTGGWGGAHFKGVASSKYGVHPFEDTKYFYVYENQRWNPLTGYTMHGLPTDRHSWSDRSGKYAMNKDTVRLPSIHWQWTTDWLIDYTTPGGVDSEGWQYATDFPSSYHGKCGFTDYVRRRRWARKCKLKTSAPWKKLSSSPSSGSAAKSGPTIGPGLSSISTTKLIDLSLHTRPDSDTVHVWAITANGEAIFREDVCLKCPEGSSWRNVPADVAFTSISVGSGPQVWAIATDGSAFLRAGITSMSPFGQFWLQVHQPYPGPDGMLKAVSVGGPGFVWVLDAMNRLYLRQEVSAVFPEGTAWHQVAFDVKTISASESELWAVLETVTPSTIVSGLVNALAGPGLSSNMKGVLARRSGITPNESRGTGWDIGIGVGWKTVSIRGNRKIQS